MSSAVGKRYARALFEVASERGKIDQVEADLGAVVQAVEQNADLSKILLHPHIAAGAKKTLVDDLFKSHISEETHNFLTVLIESGREAQLAQIQQAFVKLANEARGIADAIVTSAKPLSAEEQAELRDQMTGLSVLLASKIIEKELDEAAQKATVDKFLAQVGDRL